MLGLRKTPTPERAATPAEVLAQAEAEVVKTSDTLTAARQTLADLRASIEKERESYLEESATALLDGAARPSRERLTAAERQVPDAEDLVERLAAALTKAEQRARHAKGDVLAEQADAVRAETARRQARIHELQPQVEAMQREISQHSSWIGTAGPIRVTWLEAEARRLRSMP
jgi:chromosome segregation ATPase